MKVSAIRVASLYLKKASSDEQQRFKDLMDYIDARRIRGTSVNLLHSIYIQYVNGKNLSEKQKAVVDQISERHKKAPVFQNDRVMPEPKMELLNTKEGIRFKALLDVSKRSPTVKSIYEQYITGMPLSQAQKDLIDNIALEKKLDVVFSNTTLTHQEVSDIKDEYSKIVETLAKLSKFSIGGYYLFFPEEAPSWVKDYFHRRKLSDKELFRDDETYLPYGRGRQDINLKLAENLSFYNSPIGLQVLNYDRISSFLKGLDSIDLFFVYIGRFIQAYPHLNETSFEPLKQILAMADVLMDDIRFDRDDENSVYNKNTHSSKPALTELLYLLKSAVSHLKDIYDEINMDQRVEEKIFNSNYKKQILNIISKDRTALSYWAQIQ